MIDPRAVHETLRRHQMVDGFPFVLDLERSHGSWIHDAASGAEYLDFFTCFASWPVGYNHPRLLEPAFLDELEVVARHNPSNADLYTRHMADFVSTFARDVTPQGFPHHFWISGGALAVENALKVAFDWKARRVGLERANDGAELVILHFRQAFHGRSGYTLSLTNTDPRKIALFPKFHWPRVSNPKLVFDLDGGIANDVEADEAAACAEIEAAFEEYGWRIAAILIEPMQGEGGDNHFRPQFLAKLRQYADQKDCLLLFDEVQTGFFGSGLAWMWQHHDVSPDVVAFGKKTQVCGLYAGPRVDEVADNVFRVPSRINSTWGGNLTDMVRARRLIEIIVAENLSANVLARGRDLVDGLRALASERGGISNVRGIGSLVAFDLETTEERDRMKKRLLEKRLVALPSGERAIRFRTPFVLTREEVETALTRVADCLPARIQA
jgi:L-lysine 6-transaminase